MLQQQQILQFNGQEIQILKQINEIGKIRLFQGILKVSKQNIQIIEIDINLKKNEQLKFLVYEMDDLKFYNDKFQNIFLKTQNEHLVKLNQHQICCWEQYFQQQEFKLLPIQSKHKLFQKYCRIYIKQKSFNICILQLDQLGKVQIKSLSQRLFRNNDWINQLDLHQEYSLMDVQLIKKFGLIYFQILTDINSEQLNNISKDQKIQLIQDSPIYEWQKNQIFNLFNLKFVEQLTQQHILTFLIKKDQFEINTQDIKFQLEQKNDKLNSIEKELQQQEIIFQYSLQQSQIQNQLNYLYYQINKVKSNNEIFEEYKKVNKFNSEVYNNIKNAFIIQNDQNLIEEMLKLQLDELIKQFNQLHLKLQYNFSENLIVIHNQLQLKLDELYGPTQFLGQFGRFKISLFAKLQNQNKSIIQKLQQQIKNTIQQNLLNILDFNQSLDNLQQMSEIIKQEFKYYENQLVNCSIEIQQLLEKNQKQIQKEFENINLRYMMMIISKDESEQFSLVQSLLEKQLLLKETLNQQLNQKNNFMYTQNGKKLDIFKTSQKLQESEYATRALHSIVEKSNIDLFQFENQNSPLILNKVNQLRIQNKEKLQRLQQEFNYQLLSIKFLLSEFFKNQKNFENQQLSQYQIRINVVIQKQNQRFCIIKEVLEQDQIQRFHLQNVSMKIEEERKMINVFIQQELKMFIEQLNKNTKSQQGDEQELNQQMLDFEFMILQTQYDIVKYQLNLQKQTVKQKFTNLETEFQEQQLLLKKIEMLSKENSDLINQKEVNRNLYFNNLIQKIKLRFEKQRSSFYQFQNFLKEKKAKINLQQEEEWLCYLIEQKQNEISKEFETIQKFQNSEQDEKEKKVQYKQLRSKLEYISQEIINKGDQIGLNAQGYYQQYLLIILSKFYHMKRFYERVNQSLDIKDNYEQEDINLINQQKVEIINLEGKVDYYRNIIENCSQKDWIENLFEELENIENQIDQKKHYFQQVIQQHNENKLNRNLKQKKTIDQVQKFSNYLEFSNILSIKLIVQKND
ncbi:unnamed protein product [Paramecium sonneborni]|uniref:Uncharacterized protein n=1 Tax=Paramecium sonneborni TaxID=65129 RepID=A0A8S1NXJ4_9CILI|nr:unnamed protein product [Paramecium sonneborni]